MKLIRKIFKKETPKSVEKPSERPGMDKYRQMVKPAKLADREVKVAPFKGMDEGYAKIARSEMAASKADFESRKAASTPKPKQAAAPKTNVPAYLRGSRTELGDGDGQGRRVNLNQRIAATPRATGALENRGSDLMNITAVGAVAGLVGAGMRYVGKKAVETAGKEFAKATAKMTPAKTVASTAAKPATTNLFKQTGTKQAPTVSQITGENNPFFAHLKTTTKTASKVDKPATRIASTAGKTGTGITVKQMIGMPAREILGKVTYTPAKTVASTAGKTATKTASTVGQNTVKQTKPTTTQGRGRSLAGSDVVPMASKKVKK